MQFLHRMSEIIKVAHGRDKEAEPDDPQILCGTAIPAGDPELMVRCLIEEYARMGFGSQEILPLFLDPQYQTHRFVVEKGEVWVRDFIAKTLARCGVIRASVTGEEPPCPLVSILNHSHPKPENPL